MLLLETFVDVRRLTFEVLDLEIYYLNNFMFYCINKESWRFLEAITGMNSRKNEEKENVSSMHQMINQIAVVLMNMAKDLSSHLTQLIIAFPIINIFLFSFSLIMEFLILHFIWQYKWRE